MDSSVIQAMAHIFYIKSICQMMKPQRNLLRNYRKLLSKNIMMNPLAQIFRDSMMLIEFGNYMERLHEKEITHQKDHTEAQRFYIYLNQSLLLQVNSCSD